MKDFDEQKRLTIAAYREAGHAMACCLLHKRFDPVTINPEGMRLGQIKYTNNISKSIPSERELRLINRDCRVFLAGPVAE